LPNGAVYDTKRAGFPALFLLLEAVMTHYRIETMSKRRRGF
jgi:hypothetical protein